MGWTDRLKHAWNAFTNQETVDDDYRFRDYGISYGVRPDRVRFQLSNERSIIASVLTRLAIDIAAIPILHVRLDENGRYSGIIDSTLNNCLTVEANVDQAARALRQDLILTMFDKGVVAAVPVDTSINPAISGSYDILTMRIGHVVQWMPRHVRVSLYNDQTGTRQEVTLPKKSVALVENPLYPVMNEPNSTLQRLIRKLNLLDVVDEQSSSGKLDIMIQLPYAIRSESKRDKAEQRRKDIEVQLKDSKYGIAYTDATEKITQLNRPAENNLLQQVEFLTEMLYNQLGVTKGVFDGTADEATMLNYYNRTVEPVLSAIVEEFIRKFLTKTARTQRQTIMFLRDPFKLVPVSQLAEIADKFIRNEIMTSNEFRPKVGLPPADDPSADELRNKNMPTQDSTPSAPQPPEGDPNGSSQG